MRESLVEWYKRLPLVWVQECVADMCDGVLGCVCERRVFTNYDDPVNYVRAKSETFLWKIFDGSL